MEVKNYSSDTSIYSSEFLILIFLPVLLYLLYCTMICVPVLQYCCTYYDTYCTGTLFSYFGAPFLISGAAGPRHFWGASPENSPKDFLHTSDFARRQLYCTFLSKTGYCIVKSFMCFFCYEATVLQFEFMLGTVL